MRKDNMTILDCLLTLPKGFPFGQILDGLIKGEPEDRLAQIVRSKDNDFLWLYYWWWLTKKETLSFQQNRQTIVMMLGCEWLDRQLWLCLAAELAIETIHKVPSRSILLQDCVWHAQAKKVDESGVRSAHPGRDRFYINLAYIVAMLHCRQSVPDAVRELPPTFLTELFAHFLQWVKDEPDFLRSEQVATNLSYSIHAGFIKQVIEHGFVDITQVYRQAIAVRDVLPGCDFKPGLLLLGAHYHLHTDYDATLAAHFFSTIARTRGLDKNHALLATLARYSMQSFVLSAVQGVDAIPIMQSWVLIQKVPMVCTQLEYEIWLRYVGLFVQSGHTGKARDILRRLVVLAHSMKQDDFADIVRLCAEGDRLAANLLSATGMVKEKREQCPCIKQYSALGFGHFAVKKEREPLDDLADVVAHIRRAGIDVDITQVTEEELLAMTKNNDM